ALSSVAGSAHSRLDSLLSVAPQGAGPLTEFAQRGDLGDEVLLPPDFGLGRTEAVFAAAKRELAVAGGVQPEGSRALALRQRQTSRPLSFDDGLCHGSSAQRIGPAQSERHRQRTDDGAGGAR